MVMGGAAIDPPSRIRFEYLVLSLKNHIGFIWNDGQTLMNSTAIIRLSIWVPPMLVNLSHVTDRRIHF